MHIYSISHTSHHLPPALLKTSSSSSFVGHEVGRSENRLKATDSGIFPTRLKIARYNMIRHTIFEQKIKSIIHCLIILITDYSVNDRKFRKSERNSKFALQNK
jgi:hypothetical protein